MKIIAIGDVYGKAGLACVTKRLRELRERENPDLVVVNAENCAPTNGMDVNGAHALLDAGADVLTGGNHSLQHTASFSLLDDHPYILRPLNFPESSPGKGACIFHAARGIRVLVLNAHGQVYFNNALDNPFNATERVLNRFRGTYDFAVCDLHAEATSEKAAFAACFDGKISAIWGTHTHVQTADERILPNGSGFITDLGMCGVEHSVIGTTPEPVVRFYRTLVRRRFEEAEGEATLRGAVFTVDTSNGRCTSVRRLCIRPNEQIQN